MAICNNNNKYCNNKNDPNSGINIVKVRVGPLASVYDMVDIDRTISDIFNAWKNAVHFRYFKQLQHNKDRCKYMIINDSNKVLPMQINDYNIDQINEFEYLGDFLNAKENNDSLIKIE